MPWAGWRASWSGRRPRGPTPSAASRSAVDYNYKLNDYIYDQCTKGPLAAIKAADAAIAKAQAAQKTAKTKGQKARQHAILVQNQVARIKAVDALLDCGFQLCARPQQVVCRLPR